MSKRYGINLPDRLTAAVFVVFALLAVAVVASEARSASVERQVSPTPVSAPIMNESLLVSRIGQLGNSLVYRWIRE